MLRTAILDRLSAPLCEAVAQTTMARALLASIEKRQLLLTALDQEGEWFRYHPLLAAYLRRRLSWTLAMSFPIYIDVRLVGTLLKSCGRKQFSTRRPEATAFKPLAGSKMRHGLSEEGRPLSLCWDGNVFFPRRS